MSFVEMMERLASLPDSLILLLVSLGAGFEYIFPPFPGDTVTLAASILASLSGSAWWTIVLFSTLGSVLGSVVAWYVGHWVISSGRLARLRPSQRRSVETVLEAFEKYGPVWLAVNRFIPGLRAFFFVAAAMAKIPLGVATFWSTLSAMLWSGLLVGLGVLLADNLEALERALKHVQLLSLLIVAVLSFFVVRYIVRARRRAQRLHAAGMDDAYETAHANDDAPPEAPEASEAPEDEHPRDT